MLPTTMISIQIRESDAGATSVDFGVDDNRAFAGMSDNIAAAYKIEFLGSLNGIVRELYMDCII